MSQLDHSTLIFFVNGKKIVDENVDPEWTLLHYLRKKLGLTGTKLGCGEGGCGACTVMISRYSTETGKISNISINACLCPIASVHGMAVVTVEGIGSTLTKLHPVQERLAKSHGSQCGFCSPGFVMSMYTLLRNTPIPTMSEIEEYLVGNLCRCTGYRPILQGFSSFSKEYTSNGCGKQSCCKLTNVNGDTAHQNGNNLDENQVVTKILEDTETFSPYDPSQDIIFPPMLKKLTELDTQELAFKGPRVSYYRPSRLSRLLDLKRKFPDAKLSAGNTEIGVEITLKNQFYPVIINPMNIRELAGIHFKESSLQIGGGVTLSEIEEFLDQKCQQLKDHRRQVPVSMLQILKWFAGRQIRNVATLAGNIVTGSPISDLLPLLMSLGAHVELRSRLYGTRYVKIDDSFFTGYRRSIIKPEEILISVSVPLTNENSYFCAYKQAKRKDDDIAIVNAGMLVEFMPGSNVITKMNMAFGGMGPTTVIPKKTCEILEGSPWNEILEKGIESLSEELKLSPSAPGGMVEYRMTLAASFLLKFHIYVLELMEGKRMMTGVALETQLPLRASQYFQRAPLTQDSIDPIGRPKLHISAYKQASGEAVYVDDIPEISGELYGAFVYSTKAKASLESVDPCDALRVDGVEAFFSAKDLTGDHNKWDDQEYFASERVYHVGQVIGLVAARDKKTAQRASKMVSVRYKDIGPPIVTIEEAIEANTIVAQREICKGNPDEAMRGCDYVLQDEFRIGGQEHFCLETNAILAIPHEQDELEMFVTSQNLQLVQKCTAKALGIDSNQIVCRVKRLGGGFGGKETRTPAIAVPIALAAARLRRPVRIMTDRDEDMSNKGGRHPFLAKWKVGFNKDGKLQAIDVTLYANFGYSLDLSVCVLESCLLQFDNTYILPHCRVRGRGCRTNLPSNTAFRGFGSPQSCLMMENIISRVAEYLNMDARLVRETNLMTQSNCQTYFGQPLLDCTIQRCWRDVMQQSDYLQRINQITTFNRRNKYRKRGISINPMKYGTSFTVQHMNQGAALVHVYLDGSVLVSHGGIEMGQGLHTKMIQIASRELRLPHDKIKILETSTDKIPNAIPTSASVSSDIYGMAILDACQKIMKRMEPYEKSMPNATWTERVAQAFLDRVQLFSIGFNKTLGITDFNFEEGKGSPFAYHSYGAAVTEVEVDCLTGDHIVLRTDIVMDVGESLNPAIDIGQVEGAFIQGMGLFTLEELVYSPEGNLYTKGPGAYKIPAAGNIPREFNVSLLRGSSNPRAIYSSKAVGEPPLLLAASVFFAIRNAVQSFRGVHGGPFRLDSPASSERIRMACKDHITIRQKVCDTNGTTKAWNVRA